MKRWESTGGYRLNGKKMLSAGSRLNRRPTKDFLHLRKFQKDVRRQEEDAKAGVLSAIHGPADSVTKDTAQIVIEKLNADPNSVWQGSELLYLVRTQRSGRATSAGRRTQVKKRDTTVLPSSTLEAMASAAAANTTAVGAARSHNNSNNSNNNNNEVERYVALVRKKDSQQSISVLKIVKKSTEVEIKQSFDLTLLRAIDFGSEETELLLSFDTADYNICFHNQNERDESLWIIIQVAKHVVGNDINIGYSIDLDSLTYIATTNGTLSRFPQLHKLISAHCGSSLEELQQQGNSSYSMFSKEEAEAEVLLNELNWGADLHGHSNLLQTLSDRSATINHEIIDFLLQWEEMDEKKSRRATAAASAGNGSHGNMSNGHSHVHVNSNSNNNNSSSNSSYVSSSGSSGNFVTGVKDTGEVLRALNEVDHELETADRWLGEQIERLSSIQDNLHVIEAESSALETSWQSLNSLQEITSFIVEKYALPEQLEQLLQQPGSILKPMMASAQLSQLETLLSPLLQAATLLRDALTLSHEDFPNLTLTKFRQLQNMHSIAAQRAKLTDVADSFVSAFTPTALLLFDWVLRHRTLNEYGSSTASNSSSSNSSNSNDGFMHAMMFESNASSAAAIAAASKTKPVKPAALPSVLQLKAFDLSLVTQYCLYEQLHPAAMESQRRGSNSNSRRHGSAQQTPIPTWFVKMKSPQYNQFYAVQTTFQRFALPVLPLMDSLVDLSPGNAQKLRSSYVAATTQYLYSPLLKLLSRDVLQLLASQKNQHAVIVNLAYCSKWKHRNQIPLHFQGTKTTATAAAGIATTTGIGIVGSKGNSVSTTAAAASLGGSSVNSSNIGVSPWLAVRIVLMLISPVIEQEEYFVQIALRYQSSGRTIPGLTDNVSKPPPLTESLLYDILDSIFERPLNKLKAAMNLLNPKMIAKDGTVKETHRSTGSLADNNPSNSINNNSNSSSKAQQLLLPLKSRARENSIGSTTSELLDSPFERLSDSNSTALADSSNNSNSSSSNSAAATANKGDRDGIEAIAMLAVVSEFQSTYLPAAAAAATAPALEIASSGSSSKNGDRKTAGAMSQLQREVSTRLTTASLLESSASSSTAASATTLLDKQRVLKTTGVRFDDSTVAATSSTAAVNGNNKKSSSSSSGIEPPAFSTAYLCSVLDDIRLELVRRVQAFTADQIAWIRSQKADPKIPGVLAPFAAYPIFISQVIEMTNGMTYDCVDQLILTVTSELLSWLNSAADSNEKYAFKIKLANYSYFILQLQQRLLLPLQQQPQLLLLDQFLTYALQQQQEAQSQYMNWMVAYEFPALSALAARMDGVNSSSSNRVNEEELSLYIRRRDVINVVKELDQKHVETCVAVLWKRLLKHFKSEYDAELRLVEKSWAAIRKRVTSIVKRLQTAAEQSYQIKLAVGPQQVAEVFDRFAAMRDDSTGAATAATDL